jgi:hypothetical protein
MSQYQINAKNALHLVLRLRANASGGQGGQQSGSSVTDKSY